MTGDYSEYMEKIRPYLDRRDATASVAPYPQRDLQLITVTRNGVSVRVAFNPNPVLTTPFIDAVDSAIQVLLQGEGETRDPLPGYLESHNGMTGIYYARHAGPRHDP